VLTTATEAATLGMREMIFCTRFRFPRLLDGGGVDRIPGDLGLGSPPPDHVRVMAARTY
jgi:hypothetical protein